jgi:hypothetical protein
MVKKTAAIAIVAICVFLAVPRCILADSDRPVQMGSYIGALPLNIPLAKRNGFPMHYGTWAGNLYLYQNKLEIQQWVFNQKQSMIKAALGDAKEYAIKNKFKFYAVDNITFQVLHTESKAELFMDCNIIVWS